MTTRVVRVTDLDESANCLRGLYLYLHQVKEGNELRRL